MGKSRTRWEEVVWRDASQMLGIRECRRRAEDRRVAASSEEGRGQEGAAAPWMEYNGIEHISKFEVQKCGGYFIKQLLEYDLLLRDTSNSK